MDDRTEPKTTAGSSRSAPHDLSGWRGDIRDRPPAWRTRPRPNLERIPLKPIKPLDIGMQFDNQMEEERIEQLLRLMRRQRDNR